MIQIQLYLNKSDAKDTAYFKILLQDETNIPFKIVSSKSLNKAI